MAVASTVHLQMRASVYGRMDCCAARSLFLGQLRSLFAFSRASDHWQGGITDSFLGHQACSGGDGRANFMQICELPHLLRCVPSKTLLNHGNPEPFRKPSSTLETRAQALSRVFISRKTLNPDTPQSPTMKRPNGPHPQPKPPDPKPQTPRP